VIHGEPNFSCHIFVCLLGFVGLFFRFNSFIRFTQEFSGHLVYFTLLAAGSEVGDR
jgi:hypothetical protein